MRDVTDNRSAELPAGEGKRGRGRPPKANALTNAERQAAYRARHRNTVTVTKKPDTFRGDVMHQDFGGLEDAMAELRAELAEAYETIDEMTDELALLRAIKARCEEENGDLASMRRQIELAEEGRNKAFAAVDKLQAEVNSFRASSVPTKEYARLQLDLVELRLSNEQLEGQLGDAMLRIQALKKGAAKSVTSNEKSAPKVPTKKPLRASE
ncbi:hypothetical protein [Cupriavidus basilensis]|uniref:hypothetical protein n=1 Tax=Cupriavidus basilensis TaxID=68895 RepID=UPI0020A650A1|nr:hypothetical protein [Cupriavidus basilensis]MCP3024828.1 hypothetical protein [Cupriavidus basilensis]MDR3383111.1 hypothetical protein [Cupriavidus basilensis]